MYRQRKWSIRWQRKMDKEDEMRTSEIYRMHKPKVDQGRVERQKKSITFITFRAGHWS